MSLKMLVLCVLYCRQGTPCLDTDINRYAVPTDIFGSRGKRLVFAVLNSRTYSQGECRTGHGPSLICDVAEIRAVVSLICRCDFHGIAEVVLKIRIYPE